MVDETNPGGTAGQVGDKAGEQGKAADAGGAPAKMYTAEAYSKLMDELKALKSEKREKEVNELKAKEQYKTLAEQYAEQLKAKDQELNQFKEQQLTEKKAKAFESELINFGLDPAKRDVAFKLANLSDLVMDPETGAIVNAKERAEAFYKANADLGIFKRTGTAANHVAPGTGRPNTKPETIQEIKQRLREQAGQK